MSFISSIQSGISYVYHLNPFSSDYCAPRKVVEEKQVSENGGDGGIIHPQNTLSSCVINDPDLTSVIPLVDTANPSLLTRSHRCYDFSAKTHHRTLRKMQGVSALLGRPTEAIQRTGVTSLSGNAHSIDGIFFLDIGVVQVIEKIGHGTFGNVHKALLISHDFTNTQFVALKVSKLLEDGSMDHVSVDSLENESKFLKELSLYDPDDVYPTIKMLASGMLDSDLHFIIQPLCEMNLHEFITTRPRDEVLLSDVKMITRQLFKALSHISSYHLRLIHRDLKPSNILVETFSPIKIRLADFGSSIKGYQLNKPSDYAVTRYYRPPEIVLKLPYDHKMDVWSAACVAIELMHPYPFFFASSERDLIPMFIQFLGPIPISIDDLESKIDCPLEKTEKGYIYPADEPLPSIEDRSMYFERILAFKKKQIVFNSSFKDEVDHTRDVDLFRGFIAKCLTWLSFNRISAKEALKDPFLATD